MVTAEKLQAPQPSEFEEKEPESAPGNELQPEEQPYPEPSSKQLPDVSPPQQPKLKSTCMCVNLMTISCHSCCAEKGFNKAKMALCSQSKIARLGNPLTSPDV